MHDFFGKVILRWIIVSCLLLLVLTSAIAQDDSGRALVPDQPVDGIIDDTNAAQVYTFAANAGDSVTLTLTGQTGFALTMLLTDALGDQLGQVVGNGSERDLLLENVELTSTGTYYVTVFPSATTAETTTGSFFLTLSLGSETVVTETPETVEPTVTPTLQPQTDTFEIGQVVLSNGIQVNLTWNTTDDLNLQVRDPVGGTLFWDSRSTDFGGTFGPDVNGICETLTEPPAVETATWAGGAVSTGSYEILIFYRQACAGSSAPVDFTVDVTVDGSTLAPIEGTLLPPVNNVANVYLASFTVNPDGTATLGESGPYVDSRVLDVAASDLLALNGTLISRDEVAQGLITNEQPYETFTYEGLSGDIISIEMTATTGSLDTLLLVLDSQGTVIAANDDRVAIENTNSAIESLRLPAEDIFTIVATRYGKSVGGTEGNYELVISGSSIPTELLDLNLPSGDIEITLTWDTAADLQLLVRDPSGNSVYDDVATVPSGGRLAAQGNVNCNLAEGSPVSYIYWPDGFLRIGSYEVEVWFQSECGDTRAVFFTIYIVVEDELIFTENVSIQFNERYLTSFNIDQSGDVVPGLGGITTGSESLNYQSQLASAVQIASGQTVPGSITADDKFDLYMFEGRAGDLITIDMRATSNTLDTLLFLIDPSGVEIASNDDANETTNSLIADLLLAQDGEYTIIATHYGGIYGGTTGGYNLSFRIDR